MKKLETIFKSVLNSIALSVDSNTGRSINRKKSFLFTVILFPVVLLFPVTSQAGPFIFPSHYDGTYNLTCGNVQVRASAAFTGPGGIDVRINERIITLPCTNNPKENAVLENQLADIENDLRSSCYQIFPLEQFPNGLVLNGQVIFECSKAAENTVSYFRTQYTELIDSIIPDQVEYTAVYPNSLLWYTGVGLTNAKYNWLDEYSNIDYDITQQQFINPYNGNISWLAVTFPANGKELALGCALTQTDTTNGNINIDNGGRVLNSTHNSTLSLNCLTPVYLNSPYINDGIYQTTVVFSTKGDLEGVLQ